MSRIYATLFYSYVTRWVISRIGTVACLFLKFTQPTSEHLHKAPVENSRIDFDEMRLSISSFATESALYHPLHDRLIRKTGTSSSFWSYCTVETSLNVFLWTCVLRKPLPNVVFVCAQSNTFNLTLQSDTMNQLIVILDPLQGIWFHKTTLNNAVRKSSIVIW